MIWVFYLVVWDVLEIDSDIAHFFTAVSQTLYGYMDFFFHT